MNVKIKRKTIKKIGKKVEVNFYAKIGRESYKNGGIMVRLLGVNKDTAYGIFRGGASGTIVDIVDKKTYTAYGVFRDSDSGTILEIGTDKKTFDWQENLETIKEGKIAEILQKRVNEVKEWIATLNHFNSSTFFIEV